MLVVLAEYVQSTVDLDEREQVTNIAKHLLEHLQSVVVQQEIAVANQPGNSSSLIQNIFAKFAGEIGFRSEARGLFKNYSTAGLRPDYYLPVGNTGILLEVERGKTTMNNMDLLDFWKCHICQHANYLFLLVPRELRQNTSSPVRHEFDAVNRRLAPFFRAENYTNVRGLFLFGY